MVCDLSDLPIDALRLVYGGKDLQDNMCLCEYGITSKSTLTLLVGRLLGGTDTGADASPSSSRAGVSTPFSI